jgi:predicted RNase H-like HicB family nuclease
MSDVRRLTCIIEREGDWYVALCPELDIASQGKTIEEARNNLVESGRAVLRDGRPQGGPSALVW